MHFQLLANLRWDILYIVKVLNTMYKYMINCNKFNSVWVNLHHVY